MKTAIVSFLLALGVVFGVSHALAQDAGLAAPLPPAVDSAALPPSLPAAAPAIEKAPDDLMKDVYRGITGKDWFLLAGAVLSLVTIGVRYLLAKKWPSVETDLKGIALVAALAGLGALGTAWVADERLASATTLLGALKVWAAAVFAYVTTKKLWPAKVEATT